MATYSVLMTYPGTPDHVDGHAAVLEHNVTLKAARAAVKWQGGSLPGSLYPIVTVQNGHPVDDAGKTYRIRRSPYTVEAFARIVSEMGLTAEALV